jgi:predicted transcriptional regulator
VKKSVSGESEIDVFAKSVAKTFDAITEVLESQGKQLVGLNSMMLKSIHEDAELQKSIKEMMSQPGIKKSVSMGNAFFTTRDGRSFQLNATEIKDSIAKSADGKPKDFKSVYKSELSSVATGEALIE